MGTTMSPEMPVCFLATAALLSPDLHSVGPRFAEQWELTPSLSPS